MSIGQEVAYGYIVGGFGLEALVRGLGNKARRVITSLDLSHLIDDVLGCTVSYLVVLGK